MHYTASGHHSNDISEAEGKKTKAMGIRKQIDEDCHLAVGMVDDD